MKENATTEETKILHLFKQIKFYYVEFTRDVLFAKETLSHTYFPPETEDRHFLKVALKYHKDKEFDPLLYIKSAFSLSWNRDGKKQRRPFAYQLSHPDVNFKYKELKRKGVKVMRKRDIIIKAVYDSKEKINLLFPKQSLTDIPLSRLYQLYLAKILSPYFLVGYVEYVDWVENNSPEKEKDLKKLGGCLIALKRNSLEKLVTQQINESRKK